MEKELLLNDYKKWLFYSFDNQSFDNYYNLFKALQTGSSFRTVTITKADSSGDYTVSLEQIGERLQVTEEQRSKLIRYLIDTYFHTEDIDELMIHKTREGESAKNHNLLDSRIDLEEDVEFKVKAHPKETLYFNIKLVVSLFFYIAVGAMIVYGILNDLTMIVSLLLSLTVLLVFVLFRKIVTGLFTGLIRGSSIRITKEQYPELYKIIEEQAQRLKVEVPETYITSGHFNAFVMKFSRGHILLIFSEVLETTLKGNYDVLKYVTAHELCHIKQKHLAKEKYLFPSRIIPFLGLAYSRGCEYTCDRIGYHFSPKGSVEGILIMTAGKEIHSKFDVELHIQNSLETDGFWTWLSEKFLTHPHHYKRLIEIKKYNQYN